MDPIGKRPENRSPLIADVFSAAWIRLAFANSGPSAAFFGPTVKKPQNHFT